MKNDILKEVLLSVKNVYAELLIFGSKTIELRRRFPEDLPKGTTLFIYSSGKVRGVIGKCEVDRIERLRISQLWKSSAIEAMISWEDFSEYFQGCEYGYAIHVRRPLRFAKPRPLLEFGESRKIIHPPQSYCYV